MNRTFAGFWRDGAIVQPEDRHLDIEKTVLAKHKVDGAFDICRICYSGWSSVYWLDTTTPKELTPQEAFECYKTVYPDAKSIHKTTHGYSVQLGNGEPIINWGDTTEYPPKKRWRVPTDADKGKQCRFKDSPRKWTEHDNEVLRVFCGIHYDGNFMIEEPDGIIVTYAYCEVLD